MMVKKTYSGEMARKLKAVAVEEEKKRLMVYMPPALHDRLKAFCKERRVSMNAFAVIALETAMDHTE